jgi:pimeloyl-ACP methyl ester carboxylesterase
VSTRKRLLVFVLLAGSLAPAASARAELAFTPCDPPFECATVTVPVDRSGGVPGTIDVAVYRAPAFGPSRGVLLGLPGGPGDGGLAYFGRRLAAFDEARATHDLVFIDPRGTGRSGALRCEGADACYTGRIDGQRVRARLDLRSVGAAGTPVREML